MKKRIFNLFAICLLLGLLLSPSVFAEELTTDATQSVKYQTHVQNEGWQAWKFDGDMSGTSGKSLRLEGIRIETVNNTNLGIEYATHVQNYGWQNFKTNGDMSGTSGEGLRLEAIRIRLTGTDAENYDVWYRVHAQNVGWMGWAQNGADSGTAGYGYRLEGIEIVILPKGSEAPGKTTNAFVTPTNPYNPADYAQLFSGTWAIGTDIQPGRYAITPDGGAGNFMVYSEDGRLVVNDILGADDFGVPLIEATIPNGGSVYISGLENVIFTPVGRYLRTTLPTGIFEVGLDIAPGSYLASSTSYSGNFIIYSASGRLKTNEILGTSDIAVSKVKVELENGDSIRISGLDTVDFNQ
jgi:uncharacterized protein YjdB